MKKVLYYYAVAGVVFTVIAGGCLYFAYDYSGHNPLAGMFSPVNGSVWESMKLIFFPAFLYSICGWPFFSKKVPLFFRSSLAGVLTGTLLVAVVFYTYSGIIGASYPLLDLLTFLICAASTFSISYQLSIQNMNVAPAPLLVALNVALMVGFFAFTYAPPEAALFQVKSV